MAEKYLHKDEDMFRQDAIGNGMIFRHQDMSEEPNSR